MVDSRRNTPHPSSEAVGDYYDQMGVFLSSIFGEDIHVGIWDVDDTSSMSAAQTRLTDRLIDLLRLPDSAYVLDVGCGTGNPAMRLAERTKARAFGVSISSSQVTSAVAKSHDAGLSSRLEFIRADAMDLPCESAVFDAAWAIEMLFHVPDRLQVLREIYRAVKPGGRVVLTEFVEREPLTDQERDLLTQGFAFSSLLRPENYGDAISRSGLEVIQVHDVTAETRQSMPWFQSRYDSARDALSGHYGPEFAAQLDQLLPTGLSVYSEKLGYVIAEARRPID
ncbi:SAM-dependent methyltransferase [Kitasatospora sp. NPDC058218]|uniref:SAM-dependent methyltransferase n=1 Tax=Kitasatospora sp. NPDC058218 TaxID=3346385 RepID=UPI0036D8F7D1